VNPGAVKASPRRAARFVIDLPNTSMPTRHDDKLTEVAENVVGSRGWYVDSDPKALKAQIIPAEPPTFAEMIPFPFDRDIPQFTSPADTTWAQMPRGRALRPPGRGTGPER